MTNNVKTYSFEVVVGRDGFPELQVSLTSQSGETIHSERPVDYYLYDLFPSFYTAPCGANTARKMVRLDDKTRVLIASDIFESVGVNNVMDLIAEQIYKDWLDNLAERYEFEQAIGNLMSINGVVDCATR